jgi:hypothetical protein
VHVDLEQLGVAGLAIRGRSRRPPRFACSTRFQRVTSRVAATAFIGNRPDRVAASATAVVCPRGGERLLQDLDLEGLAAEQTLELPDPLVKLARTLAAPSTKLVGPDRFPAALSHPLPPLEQQARRQALLAGHAPSSVSSTSGIFSNTDHRRRRCTEVITSTRWVSPDIAVRLGSCLGPHAMPPVRSKRGPLHYVTLTVPINLLSFPPVTAGLANFESPLRHPHTNT